MAFGRGDKQSMVIKRTVEPLAVELVPDGSGDRFEDVRPEADHDESEVSREDGQLLLILQRNGKGVPEIHRCDSAHEAQVFLEAMLADGVDRADIEIFQASKKVAFSVRFRPVVDLSIA